MHFSPSAVSIYKKRYIELTSLKDLLLIWKLEPTNRNYITHDRWEAVFVSLVLQSKVIRRICVIDPFGTGGQSGDTSNG